MSTREQHVQKAIIHLEEAILDILLEAKEAGKDYVKGAEIEREIGVSHRGRLSEFLAVILERLEGEGQVESRINARGRKIAWRLTDGKL